MKVAISAGGRFHALHLAHQLERYNSLKNLFIAHYRNQDKDYVSGEFVKNCSSMKYLDDAYFKLRLYRLISPSSWYVFKDDLFDKWLSKQLVDVGELDIFVGWTNYWLKSLPLIRKTGAKIIAESGSTHIVEQAGLLKEEYERFGLKVAPIKPKNISKMIQEYHTADYIMVSSDFVYKSFVKQGILENKLLKVPYGVNYKKFLYKREAPQPKFRVIFVGIVGLRKGMSYLLQAWNKLNLPDSRAELLVVGNIEKSFETVLKKTKIKSNVHFYGSMSQDKLIDLYKKSSVFVLPSIEEGLAMVQGEAMANGMPVICTTNTGGEELIEDGKEGFILPIRDVDALAEKIMWCYENQDECFEMGKRAQEKIKNFTWDQYGDKIIETYKKILQKK